MATYRIFLARNASRASGAFGAMMGALLRPLPPATKCSVARALGSAREAPGPFWVVLRPFTLAAIRGLFFGTREACPANREIAPGIAMTLDLAQKTQRLLYVERVYEASLVSYFKRTVEAGDGFVDVGANAGYFTLLASRWVGPSGVVFGFEPERDNFARLTRHAAENGLVNVILHQVAAGAVEGTLTLNLNPLNEGGHSLQPRSEYFDNGRAWTAERIRERFPHASLAQEVSVRPLDALLPRDGRRWHMKIDVEGAELEALQGARAFIAHARPDICCEINEPNAELMGLLSELGYEAYLSSEDGSLSPAGIVRSGNFILRPKEGRNP